MLQWASYILANPPSLLGSNLSTNLSSITFENAPISLNSAPTGAGLHHSYVPLEGYLEANINENYGKSFSKTSLVLELPAIIEASTCQEHTDQLMSENVDLSSNKNLPNAFNSPSNQPGPISTRCIQSHEIDVSPSSVLTSRSGLFQAPMVGRHDSVPVSSTPSLVFGQSNSDSLGGTSQRHCSASTDDDVCMREGSCEDMQIDQSTASESSMCSPAILRDQVFASELRHPNDLSPRLASKTHHSNNLTSVIAPKAHHLNFLSPVVASKIHHPPKNLSSSDSTSRQSGLNRQVTYTPCGMLDLGFVFFTEIKMN